MSCKSLIGDRGKKKIYINGNIIRTVHPEESQSLCIDIRYKVCLYALNKNWEKVMFTEAEQPTLQCRHLLQ
jgi:hypothetical protein